MIIAFSRPKDGRRWPTGRMRALRSKRFIFLGLLTRSYCRTISIVDGSGKEGTVSTASRNCRNHVQRLRAGGGNAPQASGSRGLEPWILRSMRLQWHNNPSGKHQTPYDLGLCQSESEAKTAAFQGRALSQTIPLNPNLRICRLEARAGTSPPPSILEYERGPP